VGQNGWIRILTVFGRAPRARPWLPLLASPEDVWQIGTLSTLNMTLPSRRPLAVDRCAARPSADTSEEGDFFTTVGPPEGWRREARQLATRRQTRYGNGCGRPNS
jgi:hypothetical protein